MTLFIGLTSAVNEQRSLQIYACQMRAFNINTNNEAYSIALIFRIRNISIGEHA